MSILILFLQNLDFFDELLNFTKGLVCFRDLIRCQSHVENTGIGLVTSVILVTCLLYLIEVFVDNIENSIHDDGVFKLGIIL